MKLVCCMGGGRVKLVLLYGGGVDSEAGVAVWGGGGVDSEAVVAVWGG